MRTRLRYAKKTTASQIDTQQPMKQ